MGLHHFFCLSRRMIKKPAPRALVIALVLSFFSPGRGDFQTSRFDAWLAPSAQAQEVMKSDKPNPPASPAPISMTSKDVPLPPPSDKLGLFLKGGLAIIMPFDETGYLRGVNDTAGAPSNRVTNSFELGYAPTISLGYDFNKNYSAEVNFLYYGNNATMSLTSVGQVSKVTLANYLVTVDQSYHGINIWQFAFPLRLGVGVLAWRTEGIHTYAGKTFIPTNPDISKSGTNFVLKVGAGVKFNILRNFSIFSTMDVETRFDYYFVFGDRRNTNIGSGSELLLAKDFGSGGIGSFLVDFKLGF